MTILKKSVKNGEGYTVIEEIAIWQWNPTLCRRLHRVFRKRELHMKVGTELRKKKKELRGKKGFTLVELVIVIAVLAIIAFIAIPTVTNIINNANASTDNTNAQNIEFAIKTAQSEIEAQATTESARVAQISSADSDKKLTTLLKAYGVDLDLDTLRVSEHHYFYNTKSGKVVAGSSAPDVSSGSTSDYIQLSSSTKYNITGDKLTISN